MATAYHNLSEYDFNSVPNAEGMKFGIVVSEWNFNITGALLKGAVDTLKKHGAKDENILVKTVPGSFELTFGANQMMENCDVDAIIAIGCVIKGDTPHFDYVCMGATQGITELNATGDIPVIYQNFTVFRFLSTSIPSSTFKSIFCLRFALNLIVISSASPSR